MFSPRFAHARTLKRLQLVESFSVVSQLIESFNKSKSGVQRHRSDGITEKVVKGRGPGGQKINKVRNCVQLKHRQTGIQVQCQQSRSLAANRGIARKRLERRIEHHLNPTNSRISKDIGTIQKKKARSKARSKKKYGSSS